MYLYMHVLVHYVSNKIIKCTRTCMYMYIYSTYMVLLSTLKECVKQVDECNVHVSVNIEYCVLKREHIFL